jgi:hypothetical protein
MVIQSSMGAHQLDVRYGDRNTLPYYNGVVSQTLLDDVDLLVGLITAGRVMSLNTSKRLVVGVQVASDATGSQVPFYAWSGYDTNNYPDVYRTTGMPNVGELPVGGLGAPGSPGFWGVPVASGPGSTADVFATIQHIAAAELSTTEFDTTASYVPGQALTCVSTAATGADKLNRGKLRPLENATDIVVARVAPAGSFTNAAGYPCLAFTPAYVVGTTIPTTLV